MSKTRMCFLVAGLGLLFWVIVTPEASVLWAALAGCLTSIGVGGSD